MFTFITTTLVYCYVPSRAWMKIKLGSLVFLVQIRTNDNSRESSLRAGSHLIIGDNEPSRRRTELAGENATPLTSFLRSLTHLSRLNLLIDFALVATHDRERRKLSQLTISDSQTKILRGRVRIPIRIKSEIILEIYLR